VSVFDLRAEPTEGNIPFLYSFAKLRLTSYASAPIRLADTTALQLDQYAVFIHASADEDEKRKNRTKARVCTKAEWPFRIVKCVFGFTKVRYRGLKKDREWLCAAFALATSTGTASDWQGSIFGWLLWRHSVPATSHSGLRRVTLTVRHTKIR
jgi:hypothetical protein